LRLGSIGAQLGEQINEFSSDATLDGNSNIAVPTEAAVRGYFPQILTNVIPAVTATSDLGSSTKRWRDFYAGTADYTGNVTVGGDLTVNGTTTTINSTTLTVDDKNIEMGSVASPTNTTADGGGLTLKGATDKTIIWDNANANFTSSENWNLASGKTYKIANVTLLSPTVLGSTVVGSSLTSVGTLTSLTSSGVISTSDTTAATSTTSGSLKTSGGAGIAGALYVGGAHVNVGPLSVTDTTAASSSGTGALKVSGGAGITGALYAGSVFDAGNRVVTAAVANTFSAKQTFASSGAANIKLNNALEAVSASATAASGTINLDVLTQSVLYYTAAATGNFTINIRGVSGTNLDSVVGVGESITCVFLCTNGGTAYYQTGFSIDGTSITPKWQGGTAPTSGNTNAIDVYTYTVIKTGSGWTAFVSQTKFV
jgi:hypothetical protein